MSNDKKLKRKQKKFLKTADQISKNQDKRIAGKNVNQNQQDRKFKKLNKTADQVSKLKKDKTTTPINYGTMSNSIKFQMNPGSKEVDTDGTFKMDKAVKNMGIPTNYGTSPLNTGEPKPKKKLGTEDMTPEEKIEYYKQQAINRKKRKTSKISMGIGSGRSSGKNILG